MKLNIYIFKMNKTKTAILFTGKINLLALDVLIEQTKNIENKFASIWGNEKQEYIVKLSNNNFKIIYNDINQQKIYRPQFITVFNGLNYLKENGYEYVLRTRIDIVSLDYSKYLNLVCELYPEKITVIAGIETSTTYFLDIIVSGKINEMCNFCALQPINDDRYYEKFLIENYSNKINLTKDEIINIFNFSLNDCIANNIEFMWYRPISWKSYAITYPDMRVIKEYCNSSIIWV
jgi:hypothetical protein